MDAVDLPSKIDDIYTAIDMLPVLPTLGSRNLPPSLIEEFGTTVRKLAVPPFLVIYEILEEEDIILVQGLIHQRAAW